MQEYLRLAPNMNKSITIPPISPELIRQFFDAVEAKDLTTIMANFDTHAEFIDPHYPTVHMKGKEEILEGLTWGCNSLKSFGFTITNYFESKDGNSAAVEIATAHELPTGKKLNFQQVFVIEVNNGKITRLQAYEPYGPHGMNKVMLIVTRLIKKFKS